MFIELKFGIELVRSEVKDFFLFFFTKKGFLVDYTGWTVLNKLIVNQLQLKVDGSFPY